MLSKPETVLLQLIDLTLIEREVYTMPAVDQDMDFVERFMSDPCGWCIISTTKSLLQRESSSVSVLSPVLYRKLSALPTIQVKQHSINMGTP